MGALGTYSHLCDQIERLQRLLTIEPDESDEAKTRTPKQVQRRLRPAELEQLLDGYRKGIPLRDLTRQFDIHRNSIFPIVKRHGLRRRQPSLTPDQLREAAALYEAGQSLATVGKRFGCHATTVRLALLGAGVSIRPRQGWKY